LRCGQAIPLGYALDADGKPTSDPHAALAGVVLPIGGAKGSSLSMLMATAKAGLCRILHRGTV
jgi:LDH2 family malate/lactate/ureidoglycolate dehydrogenase